ncbi:Nonribosomal peptide synthetase anaPS [Fulvia fulva]|uniref:Nonribosomal peptide synthetase anaPS n=1 Tax=Passalora fulva TaxID=5499 RepID=A0A9Q8P921_PASFU|nr:Nonribosomal peptide synthetase anaPS [Fulvia fulva]KAK4624054.1 Nonribosomal peptide synthetase anaPS [Fulvia fulva]KAK4625399.1 Nonribosomal peptide synthetase anaPS [Fulvia fulva]UJO17819.1 Nonribosomal peptide synthetase anaPS [Fulvia fulva]WPV14522.1 Nonribosomal peptide synthetase anaPS [Fulvia fulva]WPV30146.1 Nonribosomal peptide synthetase anaPS [Fulvia fulva]
MPVSQTSYVASVTEFDQAVQFSSPDTQDPQTKNAVLQHIYQQLVTIELVNLRDDTTSHRLSSVPLPRPEFDTYLALFRSTVQIHSKDSAIESWDKEFTYSELDAASTAVATALRSLGVVPGDNVLLALKWSSWAPICVLAVFKVAAAFGFVEPHTTAARVEDRME